MKNKEFWDRFPARFGRAVYGEAHHSADQGGGFICQKQHEGTQFYDKEKYNFRSLVEEALELPHSNRSLESLRYEYEPFTMENNSDTVLHKKFYDKLRAGWPEFHATYDSFVEEVIVPIYGSRDFIYQTTPTFRVHLVGNWVVPEFHCDSQSGYNHPDGEINIQIAVTDMYGTNATWAESVPDLGDYAPMEMFWNQFTIFNGNECRHGNKINKSDITRVSFDFRILPLQHYEPAAAGESGTTKMRFIVGEYYKELK